jgi:hypothetical protein
VSQQDQQSKQPATPVRPSRRELEAALREFCCYVIAYGNVDTLAAAEIALRELGLWRP